MIEIKQVCFSYNEELIVDHLDLEVQEGEILCLIGPSGCGKSTLLRLIAGLLKPRSGDIIILKRSAENRAGLRFLFQDYDAFPWYTTWENVKHSAPNKAAPPDNDIRSILEQVGLANALNKYPGELSGGMRKRLALARCLVVKPAVLLLDEPFSKLDIDTRHEMYALLQRLWLGSRQTIVLVTHDLYEAVFLGSRILVSTPAPLRVRTLINIPFKYPRTDLIASSPEYLRLQESLRLALRNKV